MINNNQLKNLSAIIQEAMRLHSLDITKLAELTDIPKTYLIALTEADFEKLPATPYVRGYLIKIAEVLKIDPHSLLNAYKQEVSLKLLKISGALDKLPTNRFALNFAKKKTLIVAVIVLIFAVIFLIWRLPNLLGTPRLKIINPAADNLIVHEPTIKLSGEADYRDKLTINGEEVFIDKSNRFEKNFSLQPGINTIEFKVKRLLGKETKIIRQVIYQ